MKKTMFILIALLLLSVSCKKTVESEKKSWDVNLRTLNQLIYEYPSFTNVIKEQIKAAEVIMNEAISITDEQTKIKRMADANSTLRCQFVRNLEDIKSLKQTIRSKTGELRGLKLAFNEMMTANQAMSDGEKIIFDSDIKLRNIVNTKNDADALSNLVLSDLKLAESNITRIITTVKDREALAQKQIQADESAKKAVEQKKVEDAKPVKCGYCGELNPAGSTKCKSCGAPLTKN